MSRNFNRFVGAYNDIHRVMCDELGIDRRTGFMETVRIFTSERKRFDGAEEMSLFAELRNLSVHAQDLADPVFEPSDKAVQRLEQIRDGLLEPVSAGTRFARKVVCVESSTRLSEVMSLVRLHAYSQFPIYDRDRFEGLVSENSMMNWLADHVSENGTLIELGDHCVSDLFTDRDSRNQVRLVAADTPLDVVEAMFADEPTLEAVIVTHSGSKSEKPIGIATTWDIARE